MRRFSLLVLILALLGGLEFADPDPVAAQCTNCLSCPGGHRADAAHGNKSGFHYACLATDCGHPECTVTLREDLGDLDEFNGLLRDAVQGREGAVLALIERAGDRAVVNFARSAVQIYLECDKASPTGRVAAHIPLTGVQLAAAVRLRVRGLHLARADGQIRTDS